MDDSDNLEGVSPKQLLLLTGSAVAAGLLAFGVWWVFFRVEVLEDPVTHPSVLAEVAKQSALPLLSEKWGDRTHACQSDGDCVLTKYIDGKCCPARCAPHDSIAKDFDEALRAQRERTHCEDEHPCARARCQPPCEDYEPVCRSGRCEWEVKKLPCRQRAANCAPGDPMCEGL